LLADEAVLFGIAETYPAVDLQRLRSLRRAALSEQEQGKSPRNYRAIFQFLKGLEILDDRATGKDGHDQ
jgi:ribosome-associated protein